MTEEQIEAWIAADEAEHARRVQETWQRVSDYTGVPIEDLPTFETIQAQMAAAAAFRRHYGLPSPYRRPCARCATLDREA